MAPFSVALVPLNMDKSEAVAAATETLYQQLLTAGVDVFLDDRKERPGVKFAEMELLGIPVRVTIGDRSLSEGNIEIQTRRAGKAETVSVDAVFDAIQSLLADY